MACCRCCEKTGACCDIFGCSQQTCADCEDAGGLFQGVDTLCVGDEDDECPCEPPADPGQCEKCDEGNVASYCKCSCPDLTGITVTFEGQAFINGDSEEFTSGNATWRELFGTQYEYFEEDDVCFANSVIKSAVLNCATVDGVFRWVITLTSSCAAFDGECNIAGQAQKGWDAVLACGPNGAPLGPPLSVTQTSDSEIGDGCGVPAMPTISFGPALP